MVIDLNDYRKARTARAVVRLHAVEEQLCVNWNPAFSVIAVSCFQTPQELSPQLPDDYAALEPAFIERVYALASQI